MNFTRQEKVLFVILNSRNKLTVLEICVILNRTCLKIFSQNLKTWCVDSIFMTFLWFFRNKEHSPLCANYLNSKHRNMTFIFNFTVLYVKINTHSKWLYQISSRLDWVVFLLNLTVLLFRRLRENLFIHSFFGVLLLFQTK